MYAFDNPIIMGIVNATPDSFYANSRANTEHELLKICEKHLQEGATILDIGAMSTRPGAAEIAVEQEMQLIENALTIIQKQNYKTLISVDTYRTKVAGIAINFGADFINDIAAGDDEGMLDLIAKNGMGYMAMHKKGMPATMQQNPAYENVTKEVCAYFLNKNEEYKKHQIHSWVADPGFGFGKTTAHNFELLKNLAVIKTIVERPILIGISRKGMVYKTLNNTAESALNGTTALHTVALLKGADILRVHDVREAMEVIKLVGMI